MPNEVVTLRRPRVGFLDSIVPVPREGNLLRVFLTTMLLLAGCKFPGGEASKVRGQGSVKEEIASASQEEIDPPGSYSLADYVSECERELGPLPQITCNGEDVEVIPTRFKSVEVPDHLMRRNRASQRCDAPATLGLGMDGQCIPYSRIGRAVGGREGVQWRVACRRYYYRPKENPFFDEINVIGHDPATGGTCFFNSHIARRRSTVRHEYGVSSEAIPRPGSVEGRRFWMPFESLAQTQCAQCHSRGPWLQTPYVHQVKIGNEPSVPTHGKAAPYVIVARAQLAAVAEQASGASDLWQPKFLASKNACAACHRVGSDVWCGYYAREAVGAKWHDSLLGKGPGGGPKFDSDQFASALAEVERCCDASPQEKETCEWKSFPHP